MGHQILFVSILGSHWYAHPYAYRISCYLWLERCYITGHQVYQPAASHKWYSAGLTPLEQSYARFARYRCRLSPILHSSFATLTTQHSWGANGGVGEGGEASGSPTRLHSENWFMAKGALMAPVSTWIDGPPWGGPDMNDGFAIRIQGIRVLWNKAPYNNVILSRITANRRGLRAPVYRNLKSKFLTRGRV